MKKQKKSSKIGKACSVALKDDSLSNNNIMNKKLQNGITLIALVISIIVMLILAGVSINAIVGDNGILSRTQYATFINEMTAVEEAVQMWKAGEIIEAQGQDTKVIPTNGLCKANDLNTAERLSGEVGYYRTWSIAEKVPEMSIFSSASDFNSKFQSEIVFYPAGAQDLYYLNNEAIGIKGDKKYLIDASTGMIYSMIGIGLKGVTCYSINMAKAVMSGNIEAPMFMVAEVSGSGTSGGVINAGNTGPEYIEDENGNLIKNPNYNPNGFRIIADKTNDNVYKLYNNGDLYGKGIKGSLLNTSQEEMNNLNSQVWNELYISNEIPGYNDLSSIKIIPGNSTIYIIDKNKELWAWGDNSYNKLGLSKEQQIDYVDFKATKLNVDNKKIEKVISSTGITWVVTTTNELYVSGRNNYGQLGIGSYGAETLAFTKVDFNNPMSIECITAYMSSNTTCTLILTTEGKIYYAGYTGGTLDYNTGCNGYVNLFKGTDKENSYITNFTEIFNNVYGNKFIEEGDKIIYLARFGWHCKNECLALTQNGNLYNINTQGVVTLINSSIEKVYAQTNGGAIIKKRIDENAVEYWANVYGDGNKFQQFDCVHSATSNTWFNIGEQLVEKIGIDLNKITNILMNGDCILYLCDGKIYASGDSKYCGINMGKGDLSEVINVSTIANLPQIENFVNLNRSGTEGSQDGCFLLKSIDGKILSTSNSIITFQEEVLQKSWIKINPIDENGNYVKIKTMNATTYNNTLGVIDFNNDLWVVTDKISLLGIGKETDEYMIKNFTLLKNLIEDENLYNSFDGKIRDFIPSANSTYILTNDEDNNTLYTCGKYALNVYPSYSYSGLETDSYVFKQLLQDVKMFFSNENDRYALLNDNQSIYTWGHATNGTSMCSSITPKLINADMFNLNSEKNIHRIIFPNTNIYYVILNNGEAYLCGENNLSYVNGINVSTGNKFQAMEKSILNGETITDIVSCDSKSLLFLTENGKGYVCGQKKYMGTNDTSSEMDGVVKNVLPDEEILQVIASRNAFIIVTSGGKVYGIGSNRYGVLGRWNGVDRKDPNARCKTAFIWVECPELEI